MILGAIALISLYTTFTHIKLMMEDTLLTAAVGGNGGGGVACFPDVVVIAFLDG